MSSLIGDIEPDYALHPKHCNESSGCHTKERGNWLDVYIISDVVTDFTSGLVESSAQSEQKSPNISRDEAADKLTGKCIRFYPVTNNYGTSSLNVSM
ncbi:hypothetical protein BH10CYA1_BH10CYA1_64840 [soil metagenome]